MTTRTLFCAAVVLLVLCGAGAVRAQQDSAPAADKATSEQEPTAAERASQAASDVADEVATRVDETAKQVDQDQRAQELSAGILDPIYQLAEYFAFSSFHWLAFALMIAGVVGFALQLVLGKLVMLAKRHFSLVEIVSDGLGLLISLVGLVLTTQAATENSQFTSSPFSVLSATGVGAVVGFILYLQGQSQELKAATAEKEE